MFNFKNKKNKGDLKGAGLPTVHVVICRPLNKNTVTEVLEFDAVQRKNKDNNFYIENEQFQFNQEIDYEKHYIIEMLNYKLGLTHLSKKQKLTEISSKIIELETKKIKIKDGKLDGERVNIIDIDNDLNHLKVLRYVVDNDGEGSYEIINKNGQRELRFLARDGVYYPYFYRSDTDEGSVIDIVPDKALKQKYHRATDIKIQERFLENQSGNFWTGIKGTIITIVIGLLVLANIGWAIETAKTRSEFDSQLAKCELKCTQASTDCAFNYAQLIRDEIVARNITTNNVDISESKPVTSKVKDISNVITGQK